VGRQDLESTKLCFVLLNALLLGVIQYVSPEYDPKIQSTSELRCSYFATPTRPELDRQEMNEKGGLPEIAIWLHKEYISVNKRFCFYRHDTVFTC
jgi:hypothetical protein